MAINTEFSQLVLTAPNPEIFTIPMSIKARALLTDILKYCHTASIKLGGSVELLKQFSEIYDPIIYESAVNKYTISKYIEKANKPKAKTMNDLIKLLRLERLSDHSWVSDNLTLNPYCCGSFTNPDTIKVYTWLTVHFTIIDFNEHDLHRIIQLGNDATLDDVVAGASIILDTDKRNIAYLHSIVMSNVAKNKALKQVDKVAKVKEAAALSNIYSLLSSVTNKEVHAIESKHERWSIDSEFLDIVKDLDKNR